MLSLLTMGLLEVCIGGLPSDRPVWAPADAALIIECVDIEDSERRLIITHLIDDHAFAWDALRQSTRFNDRVGLTPEQEAQWLSATEKKQSLFDDATEVSRELRQLQRKFRNVASVDRTATLEQIKQLQGEYQSLQVDLEAARKVAIEASGDRFRLKPGNLVDFQNEASLLRQRLEADITLLLDEEELDQWLDCRRSYYRRAWLLSGGLEGEHLDLDICIRKVKPPLTNQQMINIEPILKDWRIDIDAAMARREAMPIIPLPRGPEARDRETASRVIDDMEQRLTAQRTVRDTSLDYVNRICEVLDEETASTFRNTAMTMAFPSRYHPSRMSRALVIAMEEKPEKTESLQAILENHLAKLHQIRERQIEIVLDIDGYEGPLAVCLAAGLNCDRYQKAHEQMVAIDKARRINEVATRKLLQECVGRTVTRRAMGGAALH